MPDPVPPTNNAPAPLRTLTAAQYAALTGGNPVAPAAPATAPAAAPATARRLQPIGPSAGRPGPGVSSNTARPQRDPWDDLDRLGPFLSETIQRIVNDAELASAIGLTINVFASGVVVTLADFGDGSTDPVMLAARPEPPEEEGQPGAAPVPHAHLGSAVHDALLDLQEIITAASTR